MKVPAENAPRTLLAAILVIAATGPLSWLAAIDLFGGPDPSTSALAGKPVLGPLIAFIAIPRLVFGPILIVVGGAAFFMMRGRLTRVVLAVAVVMDFIPLALYALHVARLPHY